MWCADGLAVPGDGRPERVRVSAHVPRYDRRPASVAERVERLVEGAGHARMANEDGGAAEKKSNGAARAATALDLIAACSLERHNLFRRLERPRLDLRGLLGLWKRFDLAVACKFGRL